MSTTSDAVIFEEDHASQPRHLAIDGLQEEFGFVRRARIVNRGESEFQISQLMDRQSSVRCRLGTDLSMRNPTNAYKRSEQVSKAFPWSPVDEPQVSDRPAPSEMPVRTLCGQTALRISISHWTPHSQDFERGTPSSQQKIVTGRPGAYPVSAEITLPPGSSIM